MSVTPSSLPPESTMSFHQPFSPGAASVKYVVEHRGGCVLIAGSVPMDAFATLVKLAPPDAVLDTDVARLTGSTFVFGLPDDLQRLRAEAEPAAVLREQQARPDVMPDLARWLAIGERGTSSNALFSKLSGVNANRIEYAASYPSDPSDLRRCLLMLEACPSLAARLPDAASLSPEWAGLIPAWDNLRYTLDLEAPNWRHRTGGGAGAPKTYAIMKRAIGRAA